MNQYSWKISEVKQVNNKVVGAKYYCQATDGKNTVATEGNWIFRKKSDFAEDITEHLVAHWIDLDAQDGNKHLIKSRLDEQLLALENQENNDPPWKVETFKVTL